MTYEVFIELQNRLEWLIDFHPLFLRELKPEESEALRSWFLLDVSDDDYPKSLQSFFVMQIAPFPERQEIMINSMAELYRISGAGDLPKDLDRKLSA